MSHHVFESFWIGIIIGMQIYGLRKDQKFFRGF